MPRRFNKAERDEWLSKSHTCAACCAGDCKDCAGTCDCSDCGGKKGASVLDALESKTAGVLNEPAQADPDLPVDPSRPAPRTQPCTHCSAPLAPFVIEHKLNCPHCGGKQNPVRLEGLMGSMHTAQPIFPESFMPPADAPYVDPNDQAPAQTGWGAVQPCRHCGHGMRTFEGQRGAVCPNCGNEEGVMASVKSAEVSMPPEAAVPQKETALPYNPGAYEGMVDQMHPAAQFTYERAVQQGAPPQAAMAAAQEKQGEMMKRTQEGQNVEGVQIPVINSSVHDDRDGFVTAATIKRVSHLL